MDEGVETAGVRERARPWLIAFVAVAVAVALVTATGGFRAAAADLGPELPPDQVVELRRWNVEFTSAEYTDQPVSGEGSAVDPVVRLGLVLTWKGDESESTPGAGVIDVVIDGTVQEIPYTQPVDGRAGLFDPDIPRAVLWEFKAPAAPKQVTLVLRDEGKADSFIYNDSWAAERLVGHLDVECPDRRQG